jgi:hypothetical protein
MNLTLAIDDLKFDHVPPDSASTPLSYRFSVEVTPDSSALSAIEGDSHFAEPLKKNGNADCARVVAEHVPGEVTDEYIKSHDLQAPYPEIVANKASLIFVIGKEDQFPELAILGHDRKPVYTLKCSADIWIAGTSWATRCGLFAEGSQVDLLEDSVDPYTRESRAVFQGIHTNQTCRDYPQWGATRDFELRGMKISIAESGDLENDLWAFGSADRAFGRTVKLHVQVTPEPAAESPVAKPIKIVDWLLLQRHESCNEILTH